MRRRIASLISTAILALPVIASADTGGADARDIFPPFATFAFPLSVAGTPHAQANAPGDLSPATQGYLLCASTPLTPCQYFHFGVLANVGAPASATIDEGLYDVQLLNTPADAARINIAAQNGNRVSDEGGVPLATLPIAEPVNASEWLHGAPLSDGGCYAVAGFTYRNIAMDDLVFDNATNASAAPRCTNEYHWTTRVLRGLYQRVVAYAIAHP